ncbi:MAG: S8 family serine peptidase, partial [Bacteroidota bacterium]
PRLSWQWHFQNTGQQGGTPGADIHLTEAWDIETGDTNVIVAVMDEGVQLDHPDLKQNVAYKKSYNFIINSTAVKTSDHGSHVAGTIAEVNNNGLGGNGIAGGNGSINSGVRIMSCELFDDKGNSGVIADSYIYAADNGACISNNSWAYDDEGVYELATLDAIDYFIQNGGNGIMQGGLVIFAAGNSGSPKKLYPSSYDRVICVAATNNKDKKTCYSTFGNWVDIAAPGGEFGGLTDVMSINGNGDYLFDHGTSMASPHVAGVAALVASYMKGKTSASDVREILLSTADNIDRMNPNYVGKIGTGRVNAYKALLKAKAIIDNKNIAPVSKLHATPDCNYSFTVSWNKNAANNDVIVAYNNQGGIGVLMDNKTYTTGDSIAGGGIIIYKGSGNNFQYNASLKDIYHYFKVWSNNNNQYSLGTTFDTVMHYCTSVSGYNALQQNFNYPPLFPTIEWRTVNPDNDLTWTHSIVVDTAAMGAGDHYSIAMYNYAYNTTLGAVDLLTSPRLLFNKPDSIGISFWHSYQYFNNGETIDDSLELLVTTDCGNTYSSLWKYGGKNLATVTDTSNKEWKPTSIKDWKQDFIDLSMYKNYPSITIAFKSVNGMANNLFLDNINIAVVNKNDAAIKKIQQPTGNNCSNSVSPIITLYNNGNNTIQSAEIGYTVDDGSIINTSWTGALDKGNSISIPLNNSIAAAGNHTLKVFIAGINQTNDSYNFNDTVITEFSVATVFNLPLQESFEQPAFPPLGWQINQAPYDSLHWVRNTLAASNGNASVVMPNFMPYNTYGRIEDLITPTISMQNNDSVYLYFDISYDTTRLRLKPALRDTLEVDVSVDCGNSWKQLYVKSANDLQTNKIPFAKIHEYIPDSLSQWRTDSINISSKVPIKQGDNFSIRFRNIGNYGNDIYLDNVNITTKKVGYANPFNSNIDIADPTNTGVLKSILVFNILGQKVMEYEYPNLPFFLNTIKTNQLASGVYIIKLFYTNKTVTQKLIKGNRY